MHGTLEVVKAPLRRNHNRWTLTKPSKPKQRYAVADAHNLFLYASERDALANRPPKTTLAIANARVALGADARRLLLYAADAELELRATTDDAARRWAAALSRSGINEVEPVLAMRHRAADRARTRAAATPLFDYARELRGGAASARARAASARDGAIGHLVRAALAFLRLLASVCPSASIINDGGAEAARRDEARRRFAAQATFAERSKPRVAVESEEEVQQCCVVCMDSPRTHALLPCGHKCICASCAPRLAACPICRVPKRSIVRIFDA